MWKAVMNTDTYSLLTNYLREHYMGDVSIVVNIRRVCIIIMRKTRLNFSAGSLLSGPHEFHPLPRRGDSVEVTWAAGTSAYSSVFHK